jgi:hypothetical protein
MTTRPRNSNIEAQRTRAREEAENAALRLSMAAEDIQRCLRGEFGVWMMARAAHTVKNASRALDWALDRLGQNTLSEFFEQEEYEKSGTLLNVQDFGKSCQNCGYIIDVMTGRCYWCGKEREK